MIIKHIFSILSYVLRNRLLLSIVWKRMGNVWKMGQGVWNYSTIVCFAMQVIISNERMVVIQ